MKYYWTFLSLLMSLSTSFSQKVSDRNFEKSGNLIAADYQSKLSIILNSIQEEPNKRDSLLVAKTNYLLIS